MTTAPGRFDGDGQPDVLRAYRDAGMWHLRVELSAGGAVDVTVADIAPGDALKAVGGFNIDDDGRDEAFATVGSGAYTRRVGIWTTVGTCQLTRVTVNGQPSMFPVGASVMNHVGLRCVHGATVQRLEAKANSTGSQYRGIITSYRLVRASLVQANVSPGKAIAPDDPNLSAYGAFACGGLSLSA